MLLHEYQAKQLLRQHDIPVLPGTVARTAVEAASAHASLGKATAVVKAQIHAGGRGKAGGVQLSKDVEETRAIAERLLGKPLKTHQTGPGGEMVQAVLVDQACDIAREFYLAIAVDRNRRCPILLFSSEGGVEIEQVPKDKIVTTPLGSDAVPADVLATMAKAASLSETQQKDLRALLARCTRLFHAKDLSLLEINPLVITSQGNMVALDAKVITDDNALFRQPDIAAWQDPSQQDPRERKAAEHHLSYIRLEGSIGCMVNGAGLAMATMDIIKLHGGEPANFLDVGGGADTDQVTEAFKILLSDPHVKAVLVNIFGGIMQCDVIAQGILAALKGVQLTVPLVVRLEGTRVEIGRKILKDSGLPIIEATTMDEAAKKVVQAAN